MSSLSPTGQFTFSRWWCWVMLWTARHTINHSLPLFLSHTHTHTSTGSPKGSFSLFAVCPFRINCFHLTYLLLELFFFYYMLSILCLFKWLNVYTYMCFLFNFEPIPFLVSLFRRVIKGVRRSY